MKSSKKPKTYFFAKLPAIHDKTEVMQRLIFWEGNEGYGLYIRLLERAVETRGYIPFLGVESTITEQLSFDLGIKSDKMKVVLDRLVTLGLCEYLNDGFGGLFIKQAEEFTDSKTESADRQRRFREKQRIEALQSDGEASQSDGDEDKNKNKSNSNIESNSKSDNDTIIENILSEYPQKNGKESARKQIQRRINEGYSGEKLLNAARVYAKKCKIDETPEKFIKTPSKFFSDTDWTFLDYIDKNMDDIKPSKEKKKAKTSFQEVKGRDYDFNGLEKQFAAENAEQLNYGHSQEAPCSGNPEGQHGL